MASPTPRRNRDGTATARPETSVPKGLISEARNVEPILIRAGLHGTLDIMRDLTRTLTAMETDRDEWQQKAYDWENQWRELYEFIARRTGGEDGTEDD